MAIDDARLTLISGERALPVRLLCCGDSDVSVKLVQRCSWVVLS